MRTLLQAQHHSHAAATGVPVRTPTAPVRHQPIGLAFHTRAVQGAQSARPGVGIAPPVVHEVLRAAGRPLGPAVRAYMEPRFGRDFSQVRVHTDGRAAESARAVDAAAYAVGADLVFDQGRYAPDSSAGKRLLAHELAHVVQHDAEPVLRRQPKDPAAGDQAAPDGKSATGDIRPLVQTFLDGKATPEQKAELKRKLLAGELTEAEVNALQRGVEGEFKGALEKMLPPQAGGKAGSLQITFPKEVADVHTFFQAKLRLGLSGAAKAAAGGLEGTVSTSIEVVGSKQAGTLTITVAPPPGDTALASLIRARAFPNGPLAFTLGEGALKAMNMITLQGEIKITLTGDKGAAGGGIVIVVPDIPAGVTLDLAVSQSASAPALAPPTGASALPSPRVFVTGGIVGGGKDAGGGPMKSGAAATVGVDLPLATDTKNPLLYGGIGLRGGVDTRGGLSGTGAVFTGVHLSPITVQLAIEAGVGRVPKPDGGGKAGFVGGAEVTVGYQLKQVELMALASVVGGKDAPLGASVQAGAAIHF